MATQKYDWNLLESSFMQTTESDGSKITLKTLSERFGIPYQSVRRYAAACDWVTKRERLLLTLSRRQGQPTFSELDHINTKEV